MNKTYQHTISNNEILNAIQTDSLFHVLDTNGQTQRYQSKDFTSDLISRVISGREFVESVKKSTVLAFELERSFSGVILKSASALAKHFYILDGISKKDIPPKFEVSKSVEILISTASSLNFSTADFTGNPLSGISNDGLLEAELINALITRIREETKRKSFRDAEATRKYEIAQNIRSLKRYVGRMVENIRGLQVVRGDFNLNDINITSKEAAIRIKNLIEALENDKGLSIFGFWFKREFLSEIGYRYHFVIFHNPPPFLEAQVPLTQRLDTLWHEITAGKGTFFNYQTNDASNYRSAGVGPLSSPDILVRGVNLMLNRDIFLRLIPNESIADVGMGKLPKALPQVKTNVLPLPFPLGRWTPGLI